MPIDSHRSYLEKHAYCGPVIAVPPLADLGMVVVIPCHDEPAVLATLESIWACEMATCAVEVLVVVSDSAADAADVKARNAMTVAQIQDWADAQTSSRLQVYALHFPDLLPKHAGVGLARKIGMDEAVRRFEWADNPQGIIVSLDADTVVDPQYLIAIEAYFAAHRKVESCSLRFAFRPAPEDGSLAADAILRIELAERLLVAGLRMAGHPYAFHALGAAMAVRVGAYRAQAGMSKRKAGEDFDFLQKFIELGVHGDCGAAIVYPSGRISRRKPGGIGQRVAQYCAAPDLGFTVFAVEGFVALAQGLRGVTSWYHLDATGVETALAEFPQGFRDFMAANDFPKVIAELQRYTTSEAAFVKRFFRWFHSLKTFQYFRHCAATHWPDAPIEEVGNTMRQWMLGAKAQNEHLELGELLVWFRES